MSLQDGNVKFTGGFKRGKILLAFLGVVELVLTAVFVITLASNILFPEQVSAAANAVSKVISYEGRLTDSSGNALGGTGTNYCFRFSIYDNQTVGAGTKVWPAGTPTTNTVSVVNGVFNVGIGSADDLGSYNFYDNDTVFLNIEATSSLAASCAGETSFVTLSPRQRFDAVAFARATRDVYGSLLKTINASNLVQIGSGSGAATPILLGLDWKNVADGTLSYVGQSCSTNGTMWYNSSVSRALICSGGVVQALGTTATTTIAGIGTNATAPISAGTVVLSNANGVSFGLNGSTITASVAAGGGGPTLQGSGTYTQNTGTVQFANSNGLTFGLSNNGVMTASHNGLSTARASNDAIGLNTALTANGVAWTVNSGGLSLNVPAFLTTAMVSNALTISNIRISAGGAFNNLSQFTLSNSNGVSFGLNGSVITASHNGLTTAMASNAGSNFVQANAGFNGTNASGTIASNGISISVAAPGGGGGAALQGSGTYTQNTGTVQFANSNGVTFGLSNNGVMTASVAAGGAGGYDIRWTQSPQLRFSLSNLTNVTAISNVPFFIPIRFDGNMTLSRINFEMSRSTSGSNLFTVTAGIYSYVNDTQLTLIASATESYSNTATASVSGIRRFAVDGFDVSTFTAGGYVYGMKFNAGANTASMNYSIRGHSGAVQLGAVVGGADQYNTATSYNIFPFFGRLSNTSGAMPDSVGDSQVRGQFSGVSAPIGAWIGFNDD